jgi:hypothetical protein
MVKSVEEQLTILKQITEPSFMTRTQAGLLALLFAIALVFLVVGIYLRDWTFLFPFLGFVLIGVATLHHLRHMAPHSRNARLALNSYEQVLGKVRIRVVSAEGYDYCTAGVRDKEGREWTFNFHALSWKPQTGDFPAELRYIEGVDWPALVITEGGIIFPKHAPERIK